MLRKFKVIIEGKEYVVEMEELTPTTAAAPLSASAPTTAAPAPQPAAVASAPTAVGAGETITSPMPGTILDVLVAVGDQVVENQTLCVLEAMKMENEIVAPKAGRVSAVYVTKGVAIDVGKPMVTID